MNVHSLRYRMILVGMFLILLEVGFSCFCVPVRAAYGELSACSAGFGGSQDDVAYSMIKTSDGGYALAGYTSILWCGWLRYVAFEGHAL